MASVIDRLFDGNPSFIERTPSEELLRYQDTFCVFTSQVSEQMGLRFADQLIYAEADLSTQEQREAFREGFRLGFRMMQELSEQSPTYCLL